MYLGVCDTSWTYTIHGIQGRIKDTCHRYQCEHCGQAYDFLTPALTPFHCQSTRCDGRRRDVGVSEPSAAGLAEAVAP